MHRFRPFFLVVAVAFTAYSLVVAGTHGYLGFLEVAGREPWALQMLLDLSIALLLVSSWIVVDARRHGRTAWPWVVVTALLGSIGPLWYLVFRPRSK